jgi:hypothetical protein
MLRKLFHRLPGSLRLRKVEREMDAEMRFHLEMETADNGKDLSQNRTSIV